MVAGIAAIVGALASLAGAGYSIYEAQKDPSEAQAGWQDWMRARTPASLAMSQMFFNPMFAGVAAPGSRVIHGMVPGSSTYQAWAPPDTMNRMYSHYLNRSYGLPENVARGISSASLQPLQAPRLSGASINPAQIGQASRMQPQQVTQAALGYAQAPMIRNLDYLSNASKLAQFNAWKMRQLPRIIG
ncbi:MAG: hypothetical protein ACXABY_09910 [Candidatus Thorarchaeota archaeon]|jgi:hypothetical protein